ncbi:hypothetical protein IQ277_19955 [Nostocales cyanobacterium LEGE 12452]|nr:hypothetical protein [Nostocales cyanobacterium LEGE 12452]
MGGQIFHFSPDFLNLLVDTIPKLCKSKKDVLIFFESAGVSKKDLADVSEKVDKDTNSINKYEIARTVLVAIESDRYSTLPVSANQLLRVMELKQLAKKLGFSRIKPENKQHVVLETFHREGVR